MMSGGDSLCVHINITLYQYHRLYFTVKPVFKGHSNESTTCDQGAFSSAVTSRGKC